ncbi:unnamed protein product [Medioppia subpectinata]|uniref:Nuclear receptor domain-containing protein n=1 Tax=Medioppia subpectinata TaxID=1979941 RepID=A0A7R9KLN5_9ACAR|nr:unnamed protein product [Medioppia subpectinata]CAG2104660.1 unnamed protein product [Medioppia subpectinata]
MSGKNFGAVTCESCKAFFRRNAGKSDRIVCHFNDNCTVDLPTRRCCPNCRLRKCLAVGMKENWILTESQRLERRLRIELRKQLAEENEKFSDNYIDATDDTTQQISDSDNTSTNDNDVNNYTSNWVSELQPIINDNGFYDKQNEPYIPIETQEYTEYYENTVRQEPELRVAIDRPITDYNNNFNETEFSHLNEMMFAVNHMQPKSAPAVAWEPIEHKDISYYVVAKQESDIPLMVKMCRSLRSFNLLCESDQLSLIKYGVLEVLTLRNARFYDTTTDSWILVMDLKFRHMVKYQRHVYMYLLKRYLQLKYRSESEANTRLLSLMNNFEDIQALVKIGIKTICLICGDKAVGKNFGAVSCNSCKGFFRRNAAKSDGIKCDFNNNCTIDLMTRKYCRNCRLRKCLAVGMKENWILTESQLLERKRKLELRKQLWKQNKHFIYNNIDTTDDTTQEILHLDMKSITDTDVNAYPNNSVQELESIINYNDVCGEQNLTDIAIQTQEYREYYDNTIRQEPQLPVPIDRPITDYNNNFNETEFSHLNEMMFAVNHMQPNGAPAVTWEPIGMKEILKCFVTKYESDIPLLVKMCRSLRSFNGLCESDQLSLIKYGAMELLILRNVKLYDRNSASWILVTLLLILLFDPNRPDIKLKHIVKYQRHIFTTQISIGIGGKYTTTKSNEDL